MKFVQRVHVEMARVDYQNELERYRKAELPDDTFLRLLEDKVARLVVEYNVQPSCPFCAPVGHLLETPTKGLLECDNCRAVALLGTQVPRVIVATLDTQGDL